MVIYRENNMFCSISDLRPYSTVMTSLLYLVKFETKYVSNRKIKSKNILITFYSELISTIAIQESFLCNVNSRDNTIRI